MFSCPKPLFFDYFYWQIQKFEYKKRFMSCLFLFQEVTTLPTKYRHLIWWRGHNRSWIPIQSKQTTFAHSKLFRTAVAWHHSFFHILQSFYYESLSFFSLHYFSYSLPNVLAFAISIFWLKEGNFCTLWYGELIFSLQHHFRYLQQFSSSFLYLQSFLWY